MKCDDCIVIDDCKDNYGEICYICKYNGLNSKICNNCYMGNKCKFKLKKNGDDNE